MPYRQLIHRSFITFRILVDIILIPLIIILAYSLKFKLGWFFQHIVHLNLGQIYSHAQIEPYLSSLYLVIIIWVVTLAASGAYKSSRSILAGTNEWVCVVKGVSIASLEMMAITFLFQSFPGSRFVLLYAWILGVVILGAAHALIYHIELHFKRKGIGSKKTLVIGANSIGQDIAEKMVLFPNMGYSYQGSVCDGVPEKMHYHLKSHFRRLGKIEDYDEIIQRHHIDAIFITEPPVDHTLLTDMVLFAQQHRIELRHLSDSSSLSAGSYYNDFDGLPFLTLTAPIPVSMGRIGKRVFDVVVASMIFLLGLPLWLIISVVIVYDSKGPVFYFQERIGRHGVRFNIIKFRSMTPNAEGRTGPVWAAEDCDPRITRVGKFLRRTSLDEIPQLINVIRGDMSLVGPRPERPFFVEKIEETVPHFNLRHSVRGGVTGWAQINGRSTLTRQPDHKLKYDLYYIKNWSFLFDIKIIIATIAVVLKQEEAY